MGLPARVTDKPRLTHTTAALFSTAAAAELGVGLAVLAFPSPLAEFLLAAPIEGVGVVVARMLGIGITALALTWWLQRDSLEERLRCLAPGFLVYNFGVGVLFLSYALSASRPVPVPWLIAALHLLLGLAFVGTNTFRRHVDSM